MWTEKQKEAIEKRGSNILVAASAGSGKTAVLVERVINRVINEKIDITRLLIVTFTNASASELKERLLKRIYEALDKDKSNAFLKRQVKNINIAYIDTIHSFCLKLIRTNFDVLEIDPNVKICDESYAKVLKTKAINKVIENLYRQANVDDIKKEKLYKILELFSSKDDNLISYILKIYSYINSFSYPLLTLKENIDKYNIENEDADLVNTDFGQIIFKDTILSIKVLIDKEKYLLTKISKDEEFKKIYDIICEDIECLKNIVNQCNSWDKLHNMLNQVSFSRMPTYKGENITLKDEIKDFRNNVLKGEILAMKNHVYETSSNIIKDNKIAYEYINYIYDVICEFDQVYTKLKENACVIDFSDIEHLTLKLLVKRNEYGKFFPTEIAKAIKEQFEEIYTDEYQDTSMVQEAILSAISKENNRFMVGDVKQSIYKFRQAMPEIFNEKYIKYPLNESKSSNDSNSSNVKILLSKNFRSRSGIVNSINEIFEKLMSSEIGNCNYNDIEKLEFGATLYKENEDNDYRTEINVIDLKDEAKEEQNLLDETEQYLKDLKDFEIESVMIGKKIKEIGDSFRVYNIKEEKFSLAQYKDIVILLRSIKDKGNILEKILKENGIPAFCDNSNSFFECDEIKIILSLLRIIDNPLQDISMVSVMYSIIGKFSLDDMIVIKSKSNGKSMYDSLYIFKEIILEKQKTSILTDSEKVLLSKTLKYISFLKSYIEISKIYSVSEILQKLYSETNVYNQFLLEMETSKLKIANLEYLIDIAINFEKSFNENSISSFLKYIDNLVEKVDNSSSAKIIGENENVVRIMTIHKSKGLEFPVVILADTSKSYNIRDISNTVIMDNKLGIGVNIVNEDLNIAYPSVIKQAIKSKIIKDTKSEELRMLYVALTRAKEKLFIFGTLKDYNKLLSNLNVNLNKNKIDSKIVEKNNSYILNILMALNTIEEIKKNVLFKINVYKKEHIKSRINERIGNDDIKNESIKEKINSVLDDNSIIKDERDFKKILNKNINFEYKYILDTKTPNRVSVSDIKTKKNMENSSGDLKRNNIEFKLPECLEDEKAKTTGTAYGTLMHKILMYINYAKIESIYDLKKVVKDLTQKNIIEYTNVTNSMLIKIYNFINSNIGKELKTSKNIYKEKEFVLISNDISRSQIQGIIDLYYINEKGNIILVDFKTDNLDNDASFIQKYKVQLDIYKEALERLTQKKVEKSYIYSFKLEHEIEIL